MWANLWARPSSILTRTRSVANECEVRLPRQLINVCVCMLLDRSVCGKCDITNCRSLHYIIFSNTRIITARQHTGYEFKLNFTLCGCNQFQSGSAARWFRGKTPACADTCILHGVLDMRTTQTPPPPTSERLPFQSTCMRIREHGLTVSSMHKARDALNRWCVVDIISGAYEYLVCVYN